MERIFKDLNEEQIEAVTATEGYVRIIAGAGSGKTKALTHRYAFLVKAAGIHPSNVLCVTFTNKAAGEMKKRVRALVGDGYDNSLITTYHGFCVRVLRDDIYRLMYPKSFTIIDESHQRRILNEIYSEMDIKTDKAIFEKILSAVHRAKCNEDYVQLMLDGHYSQINIPAQPGTPGLSEIEKAVVHKYIEKQRKVFGLDFDDLIAFTFVIFNRYPEVRQKWAEQLYYIQVDEFQDSSKRELRLISMLVSENKNLFVVGDPDQNIYEWRGADMSIIVDFDKRFEGTKTVFLNRNYRSTGNILKVANTLIDRNKNRIPKALFTAKNKGADVVHLHSNNEVAEGKWIADEIKRLVEAQKKQYKDIAILYRASFLSRFIEQALLEANVPYELYGSVRFYDRMEIKDALAYLKLTVTNDDDALERVINVPRRQFGKTKFAALKAFALADGTDLYTALKSHLNDPEFKRCSAAEFVRTIEQLRQLSLNMQASQLLQETLERTGYEQYIRENGSMERIENLAELKRSVWDREQSYGEEYFADTFIQQIEIESTEGDDMEVDKVKLMTVHSAKGLEFPVCFVCGMTEGIFPSSRTLEERKDEGLEEERRLCFVALTRAMERLYLTESEGTDNNNSHKRPSRFLFEMGEENYTRIGKLPPSVQNDAKMALSDAKTKQSARNVGDVVEHSVFGRGEITGVNTEKGVYIVKFDKNGAVRPVSMDYNFDSGLNWELLKQNALKMARASQQEEFEIRDKRNEELLPSQGVELLVQERDILSQQIDALPEDFDDTYPYEQEDPIFNEPEEVELWDIPEIDDDTTDEPKSMQECMDDDSVENECIDEQAEETKFPEKYVHAEWAREVLDGENLWKRDDVPHSGWYCTGMIDLGAPVGVCRMCGHQIIRYVHVMKHDNFYRTIGAGCVCAAKMEGEGSIARKRESEFKKRSSRKATFLKAKLRQSRAGNEYVRYKGNIITVMQDKFNKGNYVSVVNDKFSRSYPTKQEALLEAFDRLDPWEF